LIRPRKLPPNSIVSFTTKGTPDYVQKKFAQGGRGRKRGSPRCRTDGQRRRREERKERTENQSPF